MAQNCPKILQNLQELDVGAIAIGLPCAPPSFGPSVGGRRIARRVKRAAHEERAALLEALADMQLQQDPPSMCMLDDHGEGVADVRTRFEEEPEMWEGVAGFLGADDSDVGAATAPGSPAAEPSFHAVVSLNLLLWNHSEGWRNTFG